jgi:hypothetical protein
MGLPDSFGSLRKTRAVSARGDGANLGVKGLLNRPNSSWVAGRTGFGPMVIGEDTGLLAHVAHSKAGAAPTVLVASMQTDDCLAVDRGVEAILVGVGEFDQVITMLLLPLLRRYTVGGTGCYMGIRKGLKKLRGWN